MILTGLNQRYFCNDDVRLRLLGTIIRYKGDPFYVDDVLNNLKIQLTDYSSGPNYIRDVVDSNDDEVDIASPELAYFQHENGKQALYPLRSPERQQKQGLEPRNLFYYEPYHDGHTHIAITTSVISRITEMLKGFNYTPVSEAVKNFKKPDFQSVAFDKNFALARTSDPSVQLLYHKMHSVGYCISSEKRVLLAPGRASSLTQDNLRNAFAKSGENYNVEEIRSVA